MHDTYQVRERVSVKFPIQGVRHRYGTIEEIRQGEAEPEYLVSVYGYRLWCTAIEIVGTRS